MWDRMEKKAWRGARAHVQLRLARIQSSALVQKGTFTSHSISDDTRGYPAADCPPEVFLLVFVKVGNTYQSSRIQFAWGSLSYMP